MKKTDWAILAGTAVYSFLFHEQYAGINCLLFTCFLVVAMFLVSKEARADKGWYFYGACAIFSSVFVFLYSSDLAFFSLVVSWLLLSARTAGRFSTVLTNLLSAAYSIISSLVFFIIRVKKLRAKKTTEPLDKRGIKALIYLVSFLLLVLFFILYKQANPLFKTYTSKINLDFVTVDWFFFTVGGFLFLYGLFRHVRLPKVDDWEKRQERALEETPPSTIQTYLAQAFVFLFVVLNLMLLFINVLDINFLYMGSGLPEGITHKQFVHEGVTNLILSILLGISIILYVFKDNLNFDRRVKLLRILVYLWLVQNALMIFSTALRNHLYIMEALLTYKRIGVYFWLGLAFSGLITTFIKIRSLRRNWFLLRSNALVAFVILVLSTSLDWDLFISRYNVTRAGCVASLDKKYLLSLSGGNIGLLYPMRNHPQFETDSVWHYHANYRYSNRKELDEKVFNFLANVHNTGDWRSFNMREKETYQWIADNQHLIDTLDLSEGYHPFFNYYPELKHVKSLYLPWELDDSTMVRLVKFPALEMIGVGYFSAEKKVYLRQLPKLRRLHVRYKDDLFEKLKGEMRVEFPNLTITTPPKVD